MFSMWFHREELDIEYTAAVQDGLKLVKIHMVAQNVRLIL